MAVELVQYVEEICDLVEKLDEEFINDFLFLDKKISLPATIAAIRVYFYIENKNLVNGYRKMLYDSFHFLLTDEKCKWDSMTAMEKAATLLKTDIIKIFVFA